VEYAEVQFDCEVEGVLMQGVRALRCPSCKEEVFSPEQQEEIQKKIGV
jgi:hypothetical protein